jgi:hypothetical protein
MISEVIITVDACSAGQSVTSAAQLVTVLVRVL